MNTVGMGVGGKVQRRANSEPQTAVALDVVEGLCHVWCEACTGTSELCQVAGAGINGAKALATMKHNMNGEKKKRIEMKKNIV